MEKIELIVNESLAKYDSDTKTVEHTTRNGVIIRCEIPEKWALTRIFQFMDSLIKASHEVLI